jgi:hypothetical protein
MSDPVASVRGVKDLGDVRKAVEIMRHVVSQEKILKSLKAAARAEIEELMGGSDVGMLDGVPAVKITRYKSSRLRQADLRAAHPEVAAEFTELVSVTRIDVLDEAQE